MAVDEFGNVVPDPIPAREVIANMTDAPLVTPPVHSTHPVLQQLKDEITDLQSQVEKLQEREQFYKNLSAERASKIDAIQNSLKDVLKQKFEDGDLDSEVAKYIAEACEVEVTREMAITGTISWSGRVEVSIFEDTDELRWNTDIDSLSISYNGDDLYDLDYDMEDVESADNM